MTYVIHTPGSLIPNILQHPLFVGICVLARHESVKTVAGPSYEHADGLLSQSERRKKTMNRV